ncbi:MAG: rRNA maturation RNase YbeY [Patescibacteria group bacterium]|nr:rRNA maturation RNase YbeY [Patescibacteria group bacterium]
MATCWVGFDGFSLSGVDEEFVRFVFNVTVTMAKMDEAAEVGIVLCDDDYMQKLNKQYRKKDYVPNVLSFVYGEMQDDEFLGDDKTYLGDIFVSKSQVEADAKKLGVSVKDEFARLFVHGLLHLRGLGHENPREADKMEALEDKILAQIREAE